jgi:predicted metalloprotease with PDZ domain
MRPRYRLFFLSLFLLPRLLLGQSPVQYTLSFPNAVHHEAAITAVFPDLPATPLAVRMARSSPGRYALHEFAKNVYQVRAYNGAGQELPITRPNPHQWDISGHDGTVRLTYTLFGDRGDGTYAQVDDTHAHLNLPATLMYGLGLENRPADLVFQLPADKKWQIATQLPQRPGAPNHFYAPNLQYLMDSPVEIADLQIREWALPGADAKKTIRIAMHSPAGAADVDRYTAQAKKIVAEAGAVFGQFPAYDFDRYTFLACYVPQASGDGMEHRNSTYITSSRPPAGASADHLGTLSHEFFHSWNVERLRPRALEPFNFADANMSGELWFAEGFTSYYGELIMCRSQAYTPAAYVASLSAELNHVLNSPGHRFFSPVEMSYQAPFVDAARSIDPVNRQNTYISYYPFGSVVGLALDLSLRSRFKNLSLDTYMQAAWKNLGQPEKPYQLADLEKLLAQVTGDANFAATFFRQHVYGRELADYKTLLAPAGLLLRRRHPGQASLGGAPLLSQEGKVVLAGGSLIGSPLYLAGLDREDVILTLNGQPVSSTQDISKVESALKPGASIPITFRQRGQEKTATVTLEEDPALEVVLYEDAGLPLTKQMKAFRSSWLGAKAGR